MCTEQASTSAMLSFFRQSINELHQMVSDMPRDALVMPDSVHMAPYPSLPGSVPTGHLLKPSLTPVSSAGSSSMSHMPILPLFASAPIVAPPPPPLDDVPPPPPPAILLPSLSKPPAPAPVSAPDQPLHTPMEGRKTKRQCWCVSVAHTRVALGTTLWHSDCGDERLLNEFYPLAMEDGTTEMSTRCADCIRAQAQAWFDEQAHTNSAKARCTTCSTCNKHTYPVVMQACVYCRVTKPLRDFNLNVNFDVFCKAAAAGGDFSCGLDQLCRACSILAQSGRSRKRAADRSFVVVAEKSCTRCQEFKPADEFPRDKYACTLCVPQHASTHLHWLGTWQTGSTSTASPARLR